MQCQAQNQSNHESHRTAPHRTHCHSIFGLLSPTQSQQRNSLQASARCSVEVSRPRLQTARSVQRTPSEETLLDRDRVIPHELSDRAVHHVKRSNETPCLGRSSSSTAVPFLELIHCGEVNNCNCPARSSSAYCSEVGFCGDPILFHTS
jgi:hypothetical protein